MNVTSCLLAAEHVCSCCAELSPGCLKLISDVVYPGNTGESVRGEPRYWRNGSIELSRRKNSKMCQSVVSTHYATNKRVSKVS